MNLHAVDVERTSRKAIDVRVFMRFFSIGAFLDRVHDVLCCLDAYHPARSNDLSSIILCVAPALSPSRACSTEREETRTFFAMPQRVVLVSLYTRRNFLPV